MANQVTTILEELKNHDLYKTWITYSVEDEKYRNDVKIYNISDLPEHPVFYTIVYDLNEGEFKSFRFFKIGSRWSVSFAEQSSSLIELVDNMMNHSELVQP